ncbi:MAG TPA: hypothetical protein VGE72_03285 [Azospirillum sp.]
MYNNLPRERHEVQKKPFGRPRLDLGLDTSELVRRFEVFSSLDEDRLRQICRMFVAHFAASGKVITQRGDHAGCVYIISSRAAEVSLPGQPRPWPRRLLR